MVVATTVGRCDDGSSRREHSTVEADSDAAAALVQAAFVSEVHNHAVSPLPVWSFLLVVVGCLGR